MARSLNKAALIGNLTRDPELRYTPQGNAVCTFGLATNRQWNTESGERREDVEFHRIVSWNKLAELCAQLLSKGRKVYVEGRLQTRKWQAQDGTDRITTEIVINDMIILDSKGAVQRDSGDEFDISDEMLGETVTKKETKSEGKKKKAAKTSAKPKKKISAKPKKVTKKTQKQDDDDIPF
jgi:single-strand DNA-binding protein